MFFLRHTVVSVFAGIEPTHIAFEGSWWDRAFRNAVHRLAYDFSSTDVCPLIVGAFYVRPAVIAVVCTSDRGLELCCRRDFRAVLIVAVCYYKAYNRAFRCVRLIL